jgi:hypothetical protein
LARLAAGKAAGEEEEERRGKAQLPARFDWWHGCPGMLMLLHRSDMGVAAALWQGAREDVIIRC